MGRIIEMLFSDEPTIKKDGRKSEEDDFMIDILERGVPVKVLARVSHAAADQEDDPCVFV